MVEIRQAVETDFEAIWLIIHEVFKTGDTYPFAPDTEKATAYQIWMIAPTATYVAEREGQIIGTYYLKPNQPGLGSHVCNAGYMMTATARGQGVGKVMCQHSLLEARKLGFKGMQFNLVVSSNVAAVKLWQDMGFEVVGTLPKAFNHQALGLVDALVMYQWLEE
jgi:L-amino acid N-acyltransferase YncA